MKALSAVLTAFLENRMGRSNILVLVKLVTVFLALVVLYSVTFHVLMELEGQDHSWMTGFYWTLTVMSTLGFGDITFESDAGRFFSIVVLVTGVVFLLIILPFTFIEFFYAPFMKAQEKAKAPARVPAGTEGHVIMSDYGPVAQALTGLLDEYGFPHFVLTSELDHALDLRHEGVPVVLGNWDDPENFHKLGIERASMVVATRDDVTNTNITFTAREISERVTIVASASNSGVRDALELAGVTHILQLEQLMGETLARRVIGNDGKGHVVGELDGLFIAETGVARTSLPGKTVAESGILKQTGMTVVGRWDRGLYHPTDLETPISQNSVLLLAGTEEQMQSYNDVFGDESEEHGKVVIVGGGQVGCSLSRALTEAGIEWTLIERVAARVRDIEHKVIGDASEFGVLVEAGMREASTVIITTHNDPINTFLTIFYRRLRNNLQIISRCSSPDYARRLHRAGADLVLSYAGMGANTIFNYLRGSGTVSLGSGVNIFTTRTPDSLAGTSIKDSGVRTRTGCSIIALEDDGERLINPGPDDVLPTEGSLVLVGTLEAERRFLTVYGLKSKP
jgi:Trk K+ transport system NAD-binding subunit